MRRPNAPHRRTGFTLVELLVVVVIMSVLIGLLVPAVMRAVATARDAAVVAEITAMSQALADFRNQYGEYPPSTIIVNESGDYSAATGAASVNAKLAARTLTAFRRYWPRMLVSTSGSVPAIPGTNGFYDFNGNGTNDGTYILPGTACLVFFLGGLPQQTSGAWGMTGFSRNPQNPMQNAATSSNRTSPLFDFKSSRLISITSNNNNNNTLPGWGFPGYTDSLGAGYSDALPAYYAYFSAYGGFGYDPDDNNYADTANDTQGVDSNVEGVLQTPNSWSSSGTAPFFVASLAPNPYTSNPPVETLSDGSQWVTSKTQPNPIPRVYINPQSFQIISPGGDRHYGIGGQYLPQGKAAILPFVNVPPKPTPPYTPDSLQTMNANNGIVSSAYASSTDARLVEWDNLTNFATGKLQ